MWFVGVPESFCGDTKVFFRDTKNCVCFFGGQRVDCKIVLDILEGQKRQGWVNSRRPRSSSKSSGKSNNTSSSNKQSKNTNKKHKRQKPHTQQQVVRTAARTTGKAVQHTFRRSKAARVGFSTDSDPKQQQKQHTASSKSNRKQQHAKQKQQYMQQSQTKQQKHPKKHKQQKPHQQQ